MRCDSASKDAWNGAGLFVADGVGERRAADGRPTCTEPAELCTGEVEGEVGAEVEDEVDGEVDGEDSDRLDTGAEGGGAEAKGS